VLIPVPEPGVSYLGDDGDLYCEGCNEPVGDCTCDDEDEDEDA
jgi:hypothetical protein